MQCCGPLSAALAASLTVHHATSGNLDRRGIGDIKTLTVREYFARNWRGRVRYRLYRHPIVMFGLGPAYMFLIESRLPFGFMRKGAMPWLSTMATNAGILLAAGLLIWGVGLAPLLIVHLPIIIIGATVGVWLFYLQHQFEGATWDAAVDWSQSEAALHGSSHYDLPPAMRWFTANIGVHHLSSGIPFYRLLEVLRNHPELREIGRLSLGRASPVSASHCGTRTSGGSCRFGRRGRRSSSPTTPRLSFGGRLKPPIELGPG